MINATGDGQRAKAQVKPKKKATFDIEVFNDGGATEAFVLAGDGSSSGFTVTYTLNGSDVTGAVTASSQLTADLAPGASQVLQAKVKVAASAAKGTVKNLLVTATSQQLPNQLDTVKAKVTVK